MLSIVQKQKPSAIRGRWNDLVIVFIDFVIILFLILLTEHHFTPLPITSNTTTFVGLPDLNSDLPKTIGTAINDVNYLQLQEFRGTFHSIQLLLAVAFKLTRRHRGHFSILSWELVADRMTILISRIIPGLIMLANSEGLMVLPSVARITS